MNKDKLNFYTVDLDYVNYLKQSEVKSRGFSRVPNMDLWTLGYTANQKLPISKSAGMNAEGETLKIEF